MLEERDKKSKTGWVLKITVASNASHLFFSQATNAKKKTILVKNKINVWKL
jgi:hypothetical protein